jgi:hypothetical protein
MPRARQFKVSEKAKIMAWFGEGVPAKEIATRLGCNVNSVQKIIAANRSLPPPETPPPPKKRCGRPRLTDYTVISSVIPIKQRRS